MILGMPARRLVVPVDNKNFQVVTYTGNGTPDFIISRNVTRNQVFNLVDQVRTPGFIGSESVLSSGSINYTLDAVSAVSGGYQLVTADNRWNESGRANLAIVAASKP